MSLSVGTSLPVKTSAEVFPVIVAGMGMAPKERDKAAPTGEQTFASNCILMMQRKDGAVAPDKAASVNVLKPASVYEFGEYFEARGTIWVQPWESNDRLTYSITVEQLVPMTGDSKSSGSATASKSNGSKAGEQ